MHQPDRVLRTCGLIRGLCKCRRLGASPGDRIDAAGAVRWLEIEDNWSRLTGCAYRGVCNVNICNGYFARRRIWVRARRLRVPRCINQWRYHGCETACPGVLCGSLDPAVVVAVLNLAVAALGARSDPDAGREMVALMDYTRVQSVAIIGAGVAGLATARSLLATGLKCTLFERATKLGGVWADGYINFGVQVQRELYEFPDWPLPAGTPDFTPGPIIARYLADFADHFGITPHIRFATDVVDVSVDANASQVTARYQGSVETATFDLVVVCIGLYSNQPHIAEFPQRERFDGEVIHNSSLKSAAQLAGKRVAVVGYGKGATDAALEAAAVATTAHLIFRSAHWPIPQKLAGVLPFKWGLLQRLNLTLLPPYQYLTPVEKVVHSLGKPLVWIYWRLVETLLYFQCQLGSRAGSRVSLVSSKPIEVDAFGESTMVPRPEFFRRVRNGDIRGHKTSIKNYTESGVQLADGTHLDIDLVLG